MRRFKTQSILTRAALTLLVMMLTTTTAWAAAELRTFTFEYNSRTENSYICCNGSKALLGNGTWRTGTATLGDITTTIAFAQDLESSIMLMPTSMQNVCGYLYCIGGYHNDFDLTMTSTNKYIVHVILHNVDDESYATNYYNTSVVIDNSSKTFSYFWDPITNQDRGSLYKIDLVLNDNNQPAYKIDYELSGGTNASSNPLVYEKSKGVASFANPTKSGYTFDGWYRNADFTGNRVTSIAAGTTGDVKLYAKWRTNYTITFSPGAYGTGTMPTADVTIGGSYTLPDCGFTASGYHFTGWLVGNSTTQQSPGTSITVNSDLVITAAWAGNNYTIHYDANGGTGNIANQSCTYPNPQTLANNSFNRPGYKFSKWNTKADGTGTSYNGGQSVSLVTQQNETVTLYAQWIIDDAGFSNQGDTYYIKNLDGWNVFCDLIESGTNLFENKTVVLQNNIGSSNAPVSRMAGDNSHRFKGTFNGNNKTLTVGITNTADICGPFRYTENASFQNLTIAGTITTSNKHTGGLIGQAYGTTTIETCHSSVTINSSVNGDGTHGGFIGVTSNGTTNFTNGLFDGTIASTGGNTTNCCGGFVGWNNGPVNINSSIFAPTDISTIGTDDSYTFVRRGSNTTIDNSYYITTLGTAQGTQAYASRQSFPCNSITILGKTVYYAADLTPFGKTDNYTPDGTAEYPYIISNTDVWEYFCNALQDNDTWNRFSGKTVKLGADISVTRMAGSSDHDFCGTFDGDHHTLTFTSTADVNGVAPFSYISTTLANPDDAENSPATIKNLNVVCDINTSATHASGLVGRAWGELNIEGCTVSGSITTSNKYACGFIGEVNNTAANITDCRSSITVISSVEGDGTHGGFVGRTLGSSSLNIEGCIFDGKLLTTNGTIKCGGFIGWKGGNASMIKNCLYAPATPAEGETWVSDEGSSTLCRNGADITNCYYTEALGEAQGKQAHSITGGEGVTVEFSGTAAQYGTSGITAYGTGIMYDGVLYAGLNDEVSLNLDGSATGYSVNAGTLTGEENPFNLFMPDTDVTISAAAQFPRGDVNHDGNITIADVTTLIDYLLSNDSAIPAEADVNDDGSASIADVTALIDYLLNGAI